MPFTEDLSQFFNVAEFATPATLDGAAVAGIFDAGYIQGLVGAAGIASTGTAYMLPTASVPANPVGKALVVNGTTYHVAEHQPDGTGVSLLLLERTT
jgi:hypothetical protein